MSDPQVRVGPCGTTSIIYKQGSGMQILTAMSFARKYHRGQLRKYTNEPYIVHPFAVAGLVMSITNNENMIVAALLHDVLEDTHALEETVHTMFGYEATTLVGWLTNTAKKSDGNRAVRKQININRLAQAPPDAQTIKLADIIDNLKTILAFDPRFAKLYFAEKRETLRVLSDGNPTLFKIADDMIEGYYK